MKEHTDVEFAQAAIDMLPDDPYAIKDFLRAQGIPMRGRGSLVSCPINRWVERWTGTECWTNGNSVRNSPYLSGYWEVPLPYPARTFIDMFDAKKL